MDLIDKINLMIETISTGGTYLSGNSTIAGSQQTRTVARRLNTIIDLARKEPIEDEFDDPTDTNIIGRKRLKFDKKTGAYIPDNWN